MLGNKEAMAKNISKYMKKNKVSRNKLSEDLKVSYSTLSDWINAKTYPRIDKIEMMANYFNVNKSDLVEGAGQAVARMPFKEIPVLSKISAGVPIYAEQNIIDYTYVNETTLKNGKEYFGLMISGDSMDKEFRENDVVIVEKDSPVESGQIGVVMINGYNATVKRVRYMDDSILLMPDSNNPAHEPQMYNAEDELTVIGKIVGLNRSY